MAGISFEIKKKFSIRLLTFPELRKYVYFRAAPAAVNPITAPRVSLCYDLLQDPLHAYNR